MDELVTELFELFRLQTTTKKINLLSNIEKHTILFAEKNILQLVLRNLISNAIKFTPVGGKIEVGINHSDSDDQIYVKDSGVGIQEENKLKLFSEDKHYSTRGTQNEKGTGLGLLLCKEFIEKIGGAISVDSKISEGSTFTIYLKKVSVLGSMAV